MTNLVAYGIAVVATILAAYAGWHTYRRLTFSNPLFYAIGAFEILLVVVLVGGCIALGTTSREVDGVLFVSYLVTLVVIPPAAVLWGIAEKSRWGTGVVVISMLTVAVLAIRVLDIWKGTYA